MLGKAKLWSEEFLNIPHLNTDSNNLVNTELGFFGCTRGFLTLACPDILKNMKLTNMDSALGRKRASTEELNLGGSADSLSSSEPGQNLFKKLVKLREKIIANEHLNLKKRFAPKRKRCVSFADDKGLPLEDVHIVQSEDEDAPAKSDVTAESSSEQTNYSVTPWIMAFFQPIFNKRKMMRTFVEKGVALETVDVEDTRMSGTIKVDSAASDRKVFVRYTKDSWKTYSDVTANAVPMELDRSRAVSEAIYSFELDIPDSVLHIQFAVCLLDARGQGKWDDNEGTNFILLHHSCLEESSGSDSEPEVPDDTTKL